jgi:hypothetical protein
MQRARSTTDSALGGGITAGTIENIWQEDAVGALFAYDVTAGKPVATIAKAGATTDAEVVR